MAWEALPCAEALAVPHRRFVTMPVSRLAAKLVRGGCFIDAKSRFDRAVLGAAGFRVWRL